MKQAEITKFGQIVVGAPGSGKTTYCNALQQYFKAVSRSHVIVNLDPANEVMPYEVSEGLKVSVCSVESIFRI